ncbi:MAG: hypothetical protein EGP82_13995, partial [Odoribacter splanchnicus]|nr:hypothetical protein [Odoribacter splanchnicus]
MEKIKKEDCFSLPSVGAEGLLVTNVTREHVTNPLPFVRIFRKRKTIGENKKRKTVLVFLSVGAEGLLVTNVTREHVTNPL